MEQRKRAEKIGSFSVVKKGGVILLKRGYLPFMIIVAGCITGEMILLLGEKTDMTIAEWIAIIVAAIGLVGGIWTQIVQFHKDAQRIKAVYDENARLNSLNQELSSENILLKNQVAALTAEGEALKIQNNELKGKLEGLSERDIIQ